MSSGLRARLVLPFRRAMRSRASFSSSLQWIKRGRPSMACLFQRSGIRAGNKPQLKSVRTVRYERPKYL